MSRPASLELTCLGAWLVLGVCGCHSVLGFEDEDAYQLADAKTLAGPCGRSSLLADGFDGVELASRWREDTRGAASLAVGGGVLALDTMEPDARAGVDSDDLYELASSSVIVEHEQVAGGDARTRLIASLANSSEIGFEQAQGTLSAVVITQGIDDSQSMAAFDAQAHRFWRLLENEGIVGWEVSADGANWQRLAERPRSSLAPLDLAQLSVVLQDGGSGAPASGLVASVNRGSPSGSWCPMPVLADNFDDGATSRLWRVQQSARVQIVENGALTAVFPANDTDVMSYTSAQRYRLGGEALTVEQTWPLEPDVVVSFSFETIDGTVGFSFRDGNLDVIASSDVSDPPRRSEPYVFASHRWWRMREEGGELFWEVSGDGREWSSLFSQSAPFALEAGRVELSATTEVPAARDVIVAFDNLNLPPPP
jgi:hypothetical protein